MVSIRPNKAGIKVGLGLASLAVVVLLALSGLVGPTEAGKAEPAGPPLAILARPRSFPADSSPSGSAAPAVSPGEAFSVAPLSYRITGTIPLTAGVGSGPAAIAADPNSPLVYIANEDSHDITVVSGTKVLGMVAGVREETPGTGSPFYSMRVEVHPSTGQLYAIEGMDGRCVVQSQAFWMQIIQETEVLTTVPLISCAIPHGGGCNVVDLDVQPTNGYLYLAETVSYPAAPRQSWLLILEGDKEIARLDFPRILPQSVVADPQRGWVYMTAPYTNSFFIISGTALLDTVPISAAGQVRVQPATGLVYVQSGEEQLVVLSGTTNLAQITVGTISDLAAHPVNGYLYVSHPTTPTVTIVSGTEVLTEVAVISPAGKIEVNNATGLVYLRHALAPVVSILSGTEVFTQVQVAGGNATIESNPVTGLVYAVEGENAVAVLEENSRLGTLPAAFPPPRAMEINPLNGQIVLVGSGASSALALIQGEESVATAPLTFTPDQLVVHSHSGLFYLTVPPAQRVEVMSGTTQLASVHLEGRPQDIAVHPLNGLVYVPALDGALYILSGTVPTTLSLSPDALAHVAVDTGRGWTYVTDNQQRLYILTGTEVITEVQLGEGPIFNHGLVAVEPRSGQVYVGGNDSLWVISGTSVITHVPYPYVATQPIELWASSSGGYIYALFPLEYICSRVQVLQGMNWVAEWALPGYLALLEPHPNANTVYVGPGAPGGLLSVGVGATLVTTMTVGDGSWVEAITVDPASERVYVATDHAVTILEEVMPYRYYLPLLERSGER